ncbi:claudin-34-like, partial [Tupaia chinensis]|uniref:claudin-34-like n=1 Tax=Tupaia chinensis TaxID=246437 RepID=UPI0003C91EF6
VPGSAAITTRITDNVHCQVAGLAVATIGWILTVSSTGFTEWRVWYMESTSPPGLSCVGMWRVCIYHRESYSSEIKLCHPYTYQDTFLPLDIRVAQHLLLGAIILGLLGKTLIIFALWTLNTGVPRGGVTYKLFVGSGILHMTAGFCISAAVAWNYYSITRMQGIAFPPSFQIPYKPDTQEIGSAVLLAALAALLMLLSGLFFLSYRSPRGNKVHPEVRQNEFPSCSVFVNP